MLKAIRDLLSSKKFLTTATSVIIAAVGYFGLKVNGEAVAAFLGLIGILVHAQGQADQGKAAAQIAAGQPADPAAKP